MAATIDRPGFLVDERGSRATPGLGTVNLLRLIDEIDVLHVSGGAQVEVTSVEHDSRRVEPGALFFCVPGASTDGHDHVAEALAKGCAALVCERSVDVGGSQDVAVVRVAPGQSRVAMAALSCAFYGHPSRALLMAGVTGTNGKTTVAHLLSAVLGHKGVPTLVIGTLSGERTTPEAPELQGLLAHERDLGASEGVSHAVAMEVSSHALAQHRVEGIRFDVAVFTNLSHDHLDFHKTMEDYFQAKASLFTPAHAERAVVFADDPAGARIIERARIPVVEVRRFDAAAVDTGIGWSRFVWRGQPVEVGLSGRFNVDNALVAAEAAVALGIEPEDVAAGLSHASSVPGRMEPVAIEGEDARCTVIVDYAHTPAGLEGVLHEVAQLKRPGSKTILVFGCGGRRDAAKRPAMGAIAAALADVVVVTSDNPRDEDPMRIIEEITSGVEASGNPRATVMVEPDRRGAITLALESGEPGDVVIITGKGHERYQELASGSVPFDDRVVAQEVLACLR
ncbi:MAG: UDP-N-acetylmuramoyl-L-alanyl-D-glutamate--2,6-diaminopimelate ligase [Acidimicrobiales bacterium]